MDEKMCGLNNKIDYILQGNSSTLKILGSHSCPQIYRECIPQRVFVCFMAFLGLTICNMMRFSMSLVLTFIAAPKAAKHVVSPCIRDDEVETSSNTKKVILYHWDEVAQAHILAGFFWGYVVTQLPAGIIADLFGPRRVVFWSALMTSILTLIVGPVTKLTDHIGLMVDRIALGLMQGAFYASLHSVVAVWVPRSERGILGTFVFVGAHMGNFGSVAITGFILHGLGPYRWDWLFYIYGVCGTIWSLLFFFMTYDNYTLCPEGLLSEKEHTKLDNYFSSIHKKKKVKFTEMPWNQIGTNMPVYALTIALWGHCWGLFVMINNIPKFMSTVLDFNVQSNGMYLGSAYLVMLIIAFASGFLVDWLQTKDYISTTWNRVIFTTIASVLPSLGLLGVSYCECDGVCAFTCLIVGMGAMGTFYPSLKVNGIDLSTNYGGTVGSMSHWLGTTAGALGPPIIAAMAPDSTISQYRAVMWLTFILMSVTNIFYILFGSGNEQKFNFYEPKSAQI